MAGTDYHTFVSPFDEAVEVRWHGGATFNVLSDGVECDVFTRYADDHGNAPTLEQARRFVDEWFALDAQDGAVVGGDGSAIHNDCDPDDAVGDLSDGCADVCWVCGEVVEFERNTI